MAVQDNYCLKSVIVFDKSTCRQSKLKVFKIAERSIQTESKNMLTVKVSTQMPLQNAQ